MKKFLFALILALPILVMVSCGDEDVADDVNGNGGGKAVVNSVTKNGDELNDSLLTYMITSNDAKCPEVNVVACSKKAVKVVIPDKINYNGTLYKVTSIGEEAFRYCYNLMEVTIGSGVTSIGARAFNSCYSLTKATIGRGVKSIELEAFYLSERLTEVTCLATMPPTIKRYDYSTFSGDYATLHVKKGCKSAYEESKWEYYFESILEDAK